MPAGVPVPGGRNDPLVKDVIVEDNLVENNGVGVCVSRTARGVLLRNNQFHNVEQPVWDEAAALAAAEQRIKELCAFAGPSPRGTAKRPLSTARTRRGFVTQPATASTLSDPECSR